MANVVFHNINLHRAVFDDVNLGEATIHNANLGGLTVDDAYIKGLTIFGFHIDELIEAELDRRDPVRLLLRMADRYDPACVWASFYATLRAVDPDPLTVRPVPNPGVLYRQWSVIETLRHLVFAEDMYIHRWILQDHEPWCPLGLLPDFLIGRPGFEQVGAQLTNDLEHIRHCEAALRLSQNR
jgi:hypothetical protein